MSATIGFVSLGCPKATVDSERIISQLRAEDYRLCEDYYDADLVIVNTCGFIDEAVAESLETISEALDENGQVIVTGCLGAQADNIRARFPEVLAVTGPAAVDEVMRAVHTHLPPAHDPHLHLLPPGGIKLTPRHYAYLKIAEGCNQRCSFCIIPSMRGKLQSRPVGDVLDEAERLVSAGVKELLIVAQDTAAYGVDIKYRSGFWQGMPVKSSIVELSRRLGELGAWIRLHYVYPYPHVDKLVELMAEGVILPYLDVPLQHAVPRILKDMRRPADSENMLRRIENWRQICPDISLRSTFIVGFPGESDDDFAQLLDFIEAAQLDKVGAFPYSPVSGAAANDLPDAVDEAVKLERLEEFMALQSQISAAKLQRQIGQTVPVIVDGFDDEQQQMIARTQKDAPEIDGLVLVNTIKNPADITPGDIRRVRIVDASEHDLIGVFDD